MKKRKFYEILTNEEERSADINVYGDITSWPWFDSDVTSHGFKEEIDGLDVDTINVYINSYGGEVAEALAIYTALRRHQAEVHTFCDGFACSAASIIFCAGEKRTMGSIALLMIHNCMSFVGYGNSEELRKAAEDNDKINQSSIEAYKLVSNLSEEEIKDMMDAETWLTAQEAVDYGFATDIAEEDPETDPQQSAFGSIRTAIMNREPDKLARIEEGMNRILEAIQPKEPEPVETEEQKEPKTTNKYKDVFKNLWRD